MLLYSVDGGENWLETTEIRVAPDSDRIIPDRIVVTMTGEGVTEDVWDGDVLVSTNQMGWIDKLPKE